MKPLALLLLLSSSSPRPAQARSCVRVYYAGLADDGGACPASKCEEVCSGWLAYDESCADLMDSITLDSNWEQTFSAGRCATLLGATDSHAVSCREASNLPGRLFSAFKLLSLIGWPPRAIALLWSAAQAPAGERAQGSLFPFAFTMFALYTLVSCGWVRSSAAATLSPSHRRDVRSSLDDNSLACGS